MAKVSKINHDRKILPELTDAQLDMVAGGASTGALTITNFNPDQRGSANATQNNFGFSGGYNQ